MRSLDNLREWWLDRFPVMDKMLGEEFRWHLDAIEREAEEARDRDYRNGVEDGEMAAGRVIRCRNCRALDLTDVDWRDWCFCRNFREYVEPSGFCAWGIEKGD